MFRKPLFWLLIALAALSLHPLAARAQGIGALELTATYRSPDGTFTFDYPGGWITQAFGQIIALATDATVIDAGTPIGRGQMRASIVAAPIASLNSLTASSSLADVMQTLTTGASQSQSTGCQPYQPATAITLGGHDGLRSDQICATTENLFLVVDLGGGSVGVVGASSVLGGMTKFGATLEAVAGSMALTLPTVGLQADVTVDPSALAQTYLSVRDGLSLRYPAGWQVEESPGGLIGLSDGSQPIFPNPAMGQTTAILAVFRAGEIPAITTTSADVARWYAGTLVTDLKYGDPESFRINDRQAARMLIAVRGIDGMLLVVPLPDGGSGIMSVLTPPGSLSDVAPTLYAIAASINSAVAAAPTLALVTPVPAATETATTGPTTSPATAALPTALPTETLAPTALPPSATRAATALPTVAISPTAAPTERSATMTPAPTEESTPSVDLPQTYAEPDGSLSFHYPAGWTASHQSVNGTDFLVVSPSATFTFGPPPAGKPFGILLVSSVSQVTGKPLAAHPSQRPIDALNALIASSGGAPFSPPTGFSLADSSNAEIAHPGALSTASYPSFDNTTFIVMLDDDRYAYMNTFAAPGEMDALMPTIVAILSTVTAK